MKTTAIETVNGATIEKQTIRTSVKVEFGGMVSRRHFSKVVYFVKRDGRTVPCDTLAQAREEASK